MSQRLPSKEPVRQNGCVNEAEGVKYVSRVLRCVEGGDCVRRWITWAISASVQLVGSAEVWDGREGTVVDGGGEGGEGGFTWVFHGPQHGGLGGGMCFWG